MRIIPLCLALMGGAAAASPADARVAVEGLTALPAQWDALARDFVSAADEDRLRRLSRSSGEEIDALLASDDPRVVGAGVFAAAASGDLRRMLGLDRQMDDERPTIPRPAFVESSALELHRVRTSEPTVPQTVSELTETVLFDWFGIRASDSAQLRAAREAIADPEALIRPWVVRIRMARGDDGRLDPAVMAEVEALPEPQRWGVIAEAVNHAILTYDEARPYLKAMSRSIHSWIVERTRLLPDDPALNAYPDYRATLMEVTERALGDHDR